jgi:DNA repair protein RadC
MPTSAQTGFSFYGVAAKPIPGQLRYVEEIKVAMVRETATPQTKLDSPELSYQFWRSTVADAPWFDENKEHLVVMLLDTRYNFISYALVSIGSVNEAIAHPREVFRPAIVGGAYAIVVMHNHPSGDPSPSQADHSLTRRLHEGAELLQIKMLDHVIVGTPGAQRQPYFSFKECGVL